MVAVRVTAPGVTSPAGRATVKIGRHEVAGRVVDGFLRVVVDELPVGTHNVRVTYDGTSAILPGRATTTVKIPRA